MGLLEHLVELILRRQIAVAAARIASVKGIFSGILGRLVLVTFVRIHCIVPNYLEFDEGVICEQGGAFIVSFVPISG